MDEKNTDSTVADPNEDLQRRIRAAREKTAAFEAEHHEKEARRKLEKQARFEENWARDLPEIQKAEDEYGTIGVVNTENGAVVVKRPNERAFNLFVRRLGNERKPVDNDDYWRLVKPCIVYPDVSTVDTWTDEFAALVIQLGAKVVELGQGQVEELEGK